MTDMLNNLLAPLLAHPTYLALSPLILRVGEVTLYAMMLCYVHFFNMNGLAAAIALHFAFGLWLSHHLRVDITWVLIGTILYAQGWWFDLFFFSLVGHLGWLLAHVCAATWIAWELFGPVSIAVQVLPVHNRQSLQAAGPSSLLLLPGPRSPLAQVSLASPTVPQVADGVAPVKSLALSPSPSAIDSNKSGEALAAVNAKVDQLGTDLAAQIDAWGKRIEGQCKAAEARVVSAELLLGEERAAREVAERASEAAQKRAIICVVLFCCMQLQRAGKPAKRSLSPLPVITNATTSQRVVASRPLPSPPVGISALEAHALAALPPFSDAVSDSAEYVGNAEEDGSDSDCGWERLDKLPNKLPTKTGVELDPESKLTRPVNAELPPQFGKSLGCGPFGQCYQYQHPELGLCAVKRFAPRGQWARKGKDQEKKEVARLAGYFSKEAAFLAALDDVDSNENAAHIVKYRGYWKEEGSPRRYILTDLCDGDLEGLLERVQLTGLAPWLLLEHLMKGMLHLRARGIVHCDLKPGNILFTQVDGEYHYRIADVGVAGWANANGQLLSSAGTEGYQAPEVVYGGLSSHASDMWACFVVLQQARRNKDVQDHQRAGDLGRWFHVVATCVANDHKFPSVAKETFQLMGAYSAKDRPTPEAVLEMIEEIRRDDREAEEEAF